MSTSTDGILAYGYDLGGEESEWKVEGAGEYGELPPLGWYNPEADDADFMGAALETLLAAQGFTDVWVRGADNAAYFANRKAAEAAVGVDLECYCSNEFPMFLVAAKTIRVGRGRVKTIDWQALGRERVEQDWDGKLAAALSVLGLVPKQTAPAWLLVSYWG